MNRVLKSQGLDASAVRSLRSAWSGERDVHPAAPSAVDPELAALREETERLHRLLEQQAADMVALRREAEDAFRRGEAQGRAAGLSEAEDRSAQSLARLEGGIDRAVAEFATALSVLARLAPELARQGLATMLGDDDDRAGLVTALVHRQLKIVEAHAVVHVAVSPADFDDDALAALGTTTGVRVKGDSGLKAGDCRIRLTLGTLDIGLDQQWGRLSALLHDLAQPGGPHD